MASLIARDNGHFWVQLRIGATRKTIRLGKLPRKAAEVVRSKIESLNACQVAGASLDESTAAWVRSLSPDMSSRLAACGLIERKAAHTLGELLKYIWSQLQVKDSTEASYGHVRRNLLDFFGSDKPIASINPGDANEFFRHLQTTVSKATTAGRTRRARQFFTYAVKKRWISENPFEGIRVGGQTNESRLQYVSREIVEAVMPYLPNDEYRLLVAFGRYAGLRCPSEPLALRWEHIDWAKGTMMVHAPKTGSRVVPIFEHLRPYLEAQWNDAGESPWVISRHRITVQAYSSILTRAISRAGVPMWPRLWQQLRASCETDLMARFPFPVVVRWIGHSVRIAQAHYVMVVDSFVAEATGARKGEAEGVASELRRFDSLCNG